MHALNCENTGALQRKSIPKNYRKVEDKMVMATGPTLTVAVKTLKGRKLNYLLSSRNWAKAIW